MIKGTPKIWRSRSLHWTWVFLLCLALVASGLAKLLTGQPVGTVLSTNTGIALSLIELLACSFLLFPKSLLGPLMAFTLGCGGLALALLSPSKPCGCLGQLTSLSWPEHLAFSLSVLTVSAGIASLRVNIYQLKGRIAVNLWPYSNRALRSASVLALCAGLLGLLWQQEASREDEPELVASLPPQSAKALAEAIDNLHITPPREVAELPAASSQPARSSGSSPETPPARIASRDRRDLEAMDNWFEFPRTKQPLTRLLDGLVTSEVLFRHVDLNPKDTKLSQENQASLSSILNRYVPRMRRISQIYTHASAEEMRALISAGGARPLNVTHGVPPKKLVGDLAISPEARPIEIPLEALTPGSIVNLQGNTAHYAHMRNMPLTSSARSAQVLLSDELGRQIVQWFLLRKLLSPEEAAILHQSLLSRRTAILSSIQPK